MIIDFNKHKRIDGSYYVPVKLIICERPTHTGRIYYKSNVEKVIADYQPKINNIQAFGMLSDDYIDPLPLSQATHLLTRVWWEDSTLYGTIKLLNTDAGNNVLQIFCCGGSLFMNMSSYGSLTDIVGSTDKQVQLDKILGFNISKWEAVPAQ